MKQEINTKLINNIIFNENKKINNNTLKNPLKNLVIFFKFLLKIF